MYEKYPKSYFESQCWYENTFLVNQTNYICESNSIYNSGCHFTCLSMMLGVNPAHLSSLLGSEGYFSIDDKGLMWDNNHPSNEGDSIVIPEHYNKLGEFSKASLKLIKTDKCNNNREVIDLIEQYSNSYHHLILGSDSHSLLLAGYVNEKYFVWDPNTEIESNQHDAIEKCLNGLRTLEWTFSEYGREGLHVWVFEVT